MSDIIDIASRRAVPDTPKSRALRTINLYIAMARIDPPYYEGYTAQMMQVFDTGDAESSRIWRLIETTLAQAPGDSSFDSVMDLFARVQGLVLYWRHNRPVEAEFSTELAGEK